MAVWGNRCIVHVYVQYVERKSSCQTAFIQARVWVAVELGHGPPKLPLVTVLS